MALIEELNAVSTKHFDTPMTNQIFEESALFAWLRKKNRVTTKGGSSIQIPMRVTELGTGRSSGPREAMMFTGKETRGAGDIDWTYYDANTTLHRDEILKNRAEGKLIDLAADKAEELVEEISDKMQTDLHATSQGDKAMIPLAVWVDSATTVAGINPTNYPVWASHEDVSTEVLNLYGGTGSIMYCIAQATFGKHKPDLYITTRELFNKLGSLDYPMLRHSNNEMADLGFHNVTILGDPVVGDHECPTGYFYGIDSKQVELVCSEGDKAGEKKNGMTVTKWESLFQAGYPRAYAKAVTWDGNLIFKMRRSSFKLSNLDYTL